MFMKLLDILLSVIERLTGYALDWPSGTGGWPVLVKVEE